MTRSMVTLARSGCSMRFPRQVETIRASHGPEKLKKPAIDVMDDKYGCTALRRACSSSILSLALAISVSC